MRKAGLVLVGSFLVLGCHANTADDVEPCAKGSAQTVGEAAKTGGETALSGLETFGTSVGGLFEGGTDEAKKKWKQGADKTKQTAKDGGADTKSAARETDCK